MNTRFILCILLCTIITGCSDKDKEEKGMCPGETSPILMQTFVPPPDAFDFTARASNVDAPFMQVALVELKRSDISPIVEVYYKVIIDASAEIGKKYTSIIVLSYYEPYSPFTSENEEEIEVKIKSCSSNGVIGP